MLGCRSIYVSWSQQQTVTLAQLFRSINSVMRVQSPRPDYLSKHIVHFSFYISTLLHYEIQWNTDIWSIPWKIPLFLWAWNFNSRDTGNHCRVICFNVGNFSMRGKKGGKTNLYKQVTPISSDLDSIKAFQPIFISFYSFDVNIYLRIGKRWATICLHTKKPVMFKGMEMLFYMKPLDKCK